MGNKNKKNEKPIKGLDSLENFRFDDSGELEKKSKKEIEADIERNKKLEQSKRLEEEAKAAKEQWTMPHIKNINKPARAPYNFVPINVDVFSFPEKNAESQDTYIGKTGYIDLEIETLTPMYIRDTLSEKEYKDNLGVDEHSVDTAHLDHYSPNGSVAIPGSSLRGMSRSLIEILSYGKMKYYDDKTLYFRDFSKLPLRDVYKEYKLADNSKTSNKDTAESGENLRCGMLIKSGVKYKIMNHGKPLRIKKEKTIEEASKAGKRLNPDSWDWFKTSDNNSVIVISGSIPQKDIKKRKNKDWMLNLNKIDLSSEEPKELILTSKDINDYKDDSLRANDKMVPDLLREASKSKEGLPVFFIQIPDAKWGVRTFIGHTAMFRLPYKKSIGDHIPPTHHSDTIDLTEVMFGLEDKFSSRLYFEDAVCDSPKEEVLMGEKVPHILSGPKPTAYQHYLVQKDTNEKKLLHYNSINVHKTNPIRGFKGYWHNDGNEWEQEDLAEIRGAKKQYTKINPVKPKTKFAGRIRFENLSDVELGALLYSLDLPDGLCHKIGMGKPLGLGSVKITPKLFISDRKKRYSDIMSEWKETNAEDQSALNKFKSEFENEILSRLDAKVESLWDVDRIKELKAMLDFENKPENSKTSYMSLDEFKEKNVLPSASDVAKNR